MTEKEYYTGIVAFSTPSGRLHVGHALGQVAADVTTRYEARKQGKEIFFPWGIHSTGKDLLQIIDRIGGPNAESYISRYGLSNEIAKSILSKKNSEYQIKELVNQYRVLYEKDLTRLGISLNSDAFFSTDDTTYQKYTQWTLRKLSDKGLIVRTATPRPYCDSCDEVKAIEADFSEVSPSSKVKIEDVRIQEGTLIHFSDENGRTLPVYTTRPETAFGATNLYFNPNKKYVEVDIGRLSFLSEASRTEDVVAYFKKGGYKVLGEVDVSRLRARNPLTNKEIPMLPGKFVKSEMGSGIVMSVPSHDPFDAFYLIDSPLKSNTPQVIYDSMNNPISFQISEKDEKKLKEIRKQTYKQQEKGIMGTEAGKYKGMRVPDARLKLLEDMIEDGTGGRFFSIEGGTFYCRNHPEEKIVVRLSEDNAIDYGNEELQKKTIEMASGMNFFPKKYGESLPGIIRTRQAKPCERQREGNIGAISPFDPERRIEALADSNIYMEYYPLAIALNQGKIKSNQMTEELFNFIYLDQGTTKDISRAVKMSEGLLSELKESVNNRCPIDLNVTGLEHGSVHFPFSLFNHAAILPESFFPREYLLTSHLTRNGEKMSKSKGNVLYLDETINSVLDNPLKGVSRDASLDAIRFYLMSYQSLDRDFDWSERNFQSSAVNRLNKFIRETKEGNFGEYSPNSPKFNDVISWWMGTKLQNTVQSVFLNMDARKFRAASIDVMSLSEGISDFNYNGGENKELISRVKSDQLKMLYPFMPRITTELYQNVFGKDITDPPMQDSSMVNMEKYDKIEHGINKKDFEKKHLGNLNQKIGILRGKKILDQTESIKVFTSSEYVSKFLSENIKKQLKSLKLEFIVDDKLKEIEITQGENRI